MENLSTFVRTLGNQFIRGKKVFLDPLRLDNALIDGAGTAGTSGQVLSTTSTSTQWITVGTSNVAALDDLTDVQTGTPSNAQLLRYDSEGEIWYNWTPNFLDVNDGLNDLNGVILTSPVSNQFLKYNGSNWVNANVFLSQLGDTSITSPSADQILVYGQPLGGDPGVNVWYNKTHNFLTTSTALDDLSNVIISLQTSGDILRYNGTNWVNVPFSNLENDTLDSVTDRGSTTTNSINVGGVTTDYVQFDTAVTLDGDESQGYMAWNSDVDTVSVYPYDSQWFNIGQDMHWHVKNGTPHTIERGQVLMATGAVGNSGKIEAGLMVADGTVDAKYIIGVAIRDIGSGEFGKASTQGIIRGINTSTFEEGSVLWCDPDNAGGLTATEPTAPDLRLPIAFVVSSDNNGAIAVRIVQGNQLHELHDVRVVSPANTDILRYSTVTNRWENWTPDYISGYTESDPIFTASPASGIASTDITNWNTAYGWGNHATAGYLTALPAHTHDDRYYTEVEIRKFFDGTTAITGYNKTNWDTAYGWGNHASAGYLTGYTETDTLDSVTDRGATTTNTITVGGADIKGSASLRLRFYEDTTFRSGLQHVLVAGEMITGSAVNDLAIRANSGNMLFATGGSTERMRITSTGNVGIGTTTPGARLEVSDNTTGIGAIVGNTTHNSRLQIYTAAVGKNSEIWFGDAADSDIGKIDYDHADNSMSFTTNASEHMRITSAGNVGIGTTSPATKLHSKGEIRVDYNDTDGSTYVTGYGIEFERGTNYLRPRAADGTQTLHFGAAGDTLDWSSINFKTSSHSQFRVAGSDIMRINSTGVGIGTTSPDAPLTIHNSTDPEIRFGYSSTQDHKISWDSSKVIIHADPENANGVSALGLAVDGTTRLYIKDDGNVGIGTTSPNALLDVNKSTIGEYAYFGSGATRQLRFSSYNTASEHAGHQINASSGNGELKLATNSIAAITIDNSQNIGIGTTSPAYKLDVESGNIRVSSASSGEKSYTFYEESGGPTGATVGYDGNTNSLFLGTTDDNNATIAQHLVIPRATGNVGIGTTSPNYKLHTVGTGSVASFGDGTRAFRVFTDSDEVSLLADGSVDMKFYTNGSEKARITTSGNVGIGTTSPSYKLDVNGSFNCTSMSVTNDISTSAGNLVVQNGAGIHSIKSTIGTSSSGTAFRIANTSGVQAARATFVAETDTYKVAKIYEVVHAGDGEPVAFKVVDTGPSGEDDFSVTFTNDGGDLLCTVTNDSANESLTLVTTIFVGGSNSSQTVSNS